MRDLDAELRDSATPGRRVSKNFTTNVTDYIAAHPRKSGLGRITEVFTMKMFTKRALVTAALALAVMASCGTAYAAVGGWERMMAIFSSSTDLADGSRVVKVEAKGCKVVDAFSVTQKEKPDTYYYRIKNDSKITNEKMTEIVQAVCDVEQYYAGITLDLVKELEKNPLNKDHLRGGPLTSLVTAKTADTITLEFELRTFDNNGMHSEKKKITYPVASDVFVYDGPKKLSYADVAVGDHFSFSYRAPKSERGDIMLGTGDTTQQVIVQLLKSSPGMEMYLEAELLRGQFEHVTPCAKTPSGYCSAREYYQQHP